MSEVTSPQNLDPLTVLRANSGDYCQPSEESIAALSQTDLVLVSGQFVGAGKSMLIESLASDGYANIASWTNRDLRPGEIEGIDKCHRSLDMMAERAIAGFFLELEEIRPGKFYATPTDFDPNKRYVKDLELKGALKLREMAPQIPIIVPLPPIRQSNRHVTEWERRVVDREHYKQGLQDTAIDDLEARLEGVIDEACRINTAKLIEDPHTLFVVNDNRAETIRATRAFLETGKRDPGVDVELHIEDMAMLALDAVTHDSPCLWL